MPDVTGWAAILSGARNAFAEYTIVAFLVVALVAFIVIFIRGTLALLKRQDEREATRERAMAQSLDRITQPLTQIPGALTDLRREVTETTTGLRVLREDTHRGFSVLSSEIQETGRATREAARQSEAVLVATVREGFVRAVADVGAAIRSLSSGGGRAQPPSDDDR